MPRKRESTLSLERAEPAYVALDAACGKPEAARWWNLAVGMYWEYCQLVLREGDATVAARSGRAAVEDTLDVAATLVFRDPHVQKRWRDVRNVRDTLTGLLPAVLGGPLVIVNPKLRLDNPPGRRFGAATPGARSWDPDQMRAEFPKALARVRDQVQRKRIRRPRWIELLAPELNMSPATLRRVLDAQPLLRQLLREIAGRYVISER